jgi:3-methyladenine DNA glycosylase AlkD
MSNGSTAAVVDFVQTRLREAAEPDEAPAMQAYMKSSTPFLGVKSPARKAIVKDLKNRFDPDDAAQVVTWSRALWELPHREEKYMAIALARAWPNRIVRASLPHYEHLVRTGAWWDYVDDIAANLVGAVWRKDPGFGTVMDGWIEDEHLWIRRTAILGQLKHKEKTDERRLFRYCLQCADETDFFIRKAIGWALRQYAWVEPSRVRDFLELHRDRWSGLTFREAAKHLE